jgi:hypothetical protein
MAHFLSRQRIRLTYGIGKRYGNGALTAPPNDAGEGHARGGRNEEHSSQRTEPFPAPLARQVCPKSVPDSLKEIRLERIRESGE